LSLSISPSPSSVPPSQVTFEIQENFGNSQSHQNQQSLSSSTNEIEISAASDAPWRGILRKTESKINLNE